MDALEQCCRRLAQRLAFYCREKMTAPKHSLGFLHGLLAAAQNKQKKRHDRRRAAVRIAGALEENP
jgi:hypothetical protein